MGKPKERAWQERSWMGWIMKGPVCDLKELGVYPESHRELLKGVLSRGVL